METIKDLVELNKDVKLGTTIGNFDGVHLGHRDLISRSLKECKKHNLSFLVITFNPHPRELFGDANNYYLNSFEEKKELLASLGVDYYLEIDFNLNFSKIGPKEFFDKFIFQTAQVERLFLGFDFFFGNNKSGDLDFAKNYCSEKNISLTIQPKFESDNMPVSSSIIRNFLAEGLVSKANQYLSRSYFLEGMVQKGDGRGASLGFPTANLNIDKKRKVPKNGVYLTHTFIQNKIFKSLTNIGTNPTFKDDVLKSIETHVLEFNQDLYNKKIKIEFILRIRDEKKFDGPEGLISQIKIDINSLKEFNSK